MQILPNRLKYLRRLNIKGGVKVAGFKGARINMPRRGTCWTMERVGINVSLAQIHLCVPPSAPPPPSQVNFSLFTFCTSYNS